NVLKAQNGEDAMRVAKQFEGKIDLLLTDVVMPKMGGYELASVLPGFIKGLKVLFVSGYASLDLPHQATIDPRHGYLQKPFTGIVLTKKVREILDTQE
ncbi:MAG: response regulator, partial [Verrucomicrobia bacterium]|nr:response regulator [Verrucomicrobiota bacterium]